MDISSTATFPAQPLDVYALLTDRSFLEEVAREQGATEWDVQVVNGTTTSKRTLPAPPEAQRFTGKRLTVVEEIAWGEATADGARTGTLSVKVPGQPIGMEGEVRLSPAGEETTCTITGDLKANIPLLGRKIEQMAAPAMLQGIKVQEKVGRRRLAG